MAHIKHNLSARGDSWLYTLEGATETRVPKLMWGGKPTSPPTTLLESRTGLEGQIRPVRTLSSS